MSFFNSIGFYFKTGNLYVSILVLVDVFLQPDSTLAFNLSYNCFNPCFSGCLSSTNRGASNVTDPPFGFNPCFSGCLSSTLKAKNQNCLRGPVSILVLVDVFLQLRKPSTGILWTPCFNPCFSGCLSSTPCGSVSASTLLMFQSLF